MIVMAVLYEVDEGREAILTFYLSNSYMETELQNFR